MVPKLLPRYITCKLECALIPVLRIEFYWLRNGVEESSLSFQYKETTCKLPYADATQAGRLAKQSQWR